MVRPVINGPSLLETMMPTVSSDVTDGLSQTRVTFSAKPAPLDTPSSRPDAERQPGVHVSQILCVAILRQPLLRRTFETHRPGRTYAVGVRLGRLECVYYETAFSSARAWSIWSYA
jgi:hypothetical protein